MLHYKLSKNIVLLIISAAVLLIESWYVGVQVTHLIAAIVGSTAGSLVIVYFRREKSQVETILKIIVSSSCGVILGAATIEYLQIEKTAYLLTAYFFCSLNAIVFFRGLIGILDVSLKQILLQIISRVLDVKIASRAPYVFKKDGRRISKHGAFHKDAQTKTGAETDAETAQKKEDLKKNGVDDNTK
jgi:hypothetical protein